MAIKLEGWWLQYTEVWNGYTAPEQLKVRLIGAAFGHPDHQDGKIIKTTRIVKTEGRTVTTRSGSVYELGEPDARYVEYVRSLGREIDPINPIQMKD